jgi:hypothetical protein
MHLIADKSVHARLLIMGGLMELISGRNKSIFQAAFRFTWPLYHWLPGAFCLGVKWLQLVADHSSSSSAERRIRENLPSVSWHSHGLEYGMDNQPVPLQFENITTL